MTQRVLKWVQLFVLTLWIVVSASLLYPLLDVPIRESVGPVNSFTAVAQENSAVALMQSGQQQYETGQFLLAAQSLEQAAGAAVGSLQRAQAYGLQALAWEKLGQWDEARGAIAQSLALLESVPENSPDKPRIRAQVLNAQGHVEFSLGQAERAMESWTAAESDYRKADATAAVLGSQINQAQALQSLGFYRRAESLLHQIEADLQEEPQSAIKVKGLLSFGNVLRLGGEVERAEAVLSDGLAMASALGLSAVEGQALLSLGNTERVLAVRAAEIRAAAVGAAHVQQAMDYYEAAEKAAVLPVGRVQAQLNRLSLWVENGEIERARRGRSQLLQSIQTLPPSRAAIDARVNLARQSMAIAPEAATTIAQNLSTAIQQARDIQDKRAESYALGVLGQLYEQAEDLVNATSVTANALSLAQAIRAPDIAYQWQWQMGRLLSLGATATSSLSAVDYYTAAVETLEGLRSDLVALNPDIQFSFRERVEPVYRELVDLLLQDEKPTMAQMKQARTVMEALQLAELDNFFRDACAKPQEVNIDRVDMNAAVVYPIVLKDRLAVILKLPGADNLRYYTTREANELQIDAVVSALTQKMNRRSTLPASLQVEAQQLYTWLLEPFAAELQAQMPREQSEIKTLVFVLDGSLRNVPMAALYDGRRYLMERYAIALTPGLQLLAPQALQQNDLRVLVAGATDAPSFMKAGLNSLDNVAFEIAGVESEVARATSLEDEDFLQATVRERLGAATFNVVHLATHGNFSSNPERTFLLDWDSRISANDIDTLFQVGNPGELSSVELLVLSACETAAGDKRAALGLAGIAIRADVRSTLATLWQVNDTSTAEFMVRFYEVWAQGKVTKAEALRTVQMAFLKEYADTDYNRPFHWAAFTLVGNWL